MLNRDFSQQIKCNLSYHPTVDQENAIALLSDYVFSSGRQRVFLLEGYAGTGKTSLVGALVKTLDEHEVRFIGSYRTGGKGFCTLRRAFCLYYSPDDLSATCVFS